MPPLEPTTGAFLLQAAQTIIQNSRQAEALDFQREQFEEKVRASEEAAVAKERQLDLREQFLQLQQQQAAAKAAAKPLEEFATFAGAVKNLAGAKAALQPEAKGRVTTSAQRLILQEARRMQSFEALSGKVITVGGTQQKVDLTEFATRTQQDMQSEIMRLQTEVTSQAALAELSPAVQATVKQKQNRISRLRVAIETVTAVGPVPSPTQINAATRLVLGLGEDVSDVVVGAAVQNTLQNAADPDALTQELLGIGNSPVSPTIVDEALQLAGQGNISGLASLGRRAFMQKGGQVDVERFRKFYDLIESKTDTDTTNEIFDKLVEQLGLR
jgi:hypothetical protein